MAQGSLALLFLTSFVVFTAAEDCAEIPIECSGDGELPDEVPDNPMPLASADVVFLVDGSTSIGEKSFILGKNFIADYISEFNIGKYATRVGVITFGSDVIVNCELQDSGIIGLDKTVAKIKAIQLPGGGTKTGQGVKALTTLFQTQGRLNQPEIKSVGFILTDGRSQEPPGEYAAIARNLGIVLYAIGIGEEINRDELISIAGDKERVFLVENFEQLADLKAKVQILPQAELMPVPPKPKGRGIKCVQLECMLDDEGVPTMRVYVPESLNTCCSGRIGSCDRITYKGFKQAPNWWRPSTRQLSSYHFRESDRPGFVQRDVKAGECGTKFNVAADDLEYTNILNLYEESDDRTVVRDETEWRLKCKYPRNQLKTVMYDTSRRVRNVTNDGLIPMFLEIFDAGYEERMPMPAIFKLKERVHVQASMPTHDKLELFPVKCWATDGADPAGSPVKTLIVNGCDVEPTLQRERETTPIHDRFSFEAFRFKDVGSCKVYVHCDLLICAAGDPASRCSQGCLSSRRKRSASEGSFLSEQKLTVGPLLVGDQQNDAKTEVDAVSRMNRLQEVGKKLSQMMLNLKRGRRAFRTRF